MDMELISAASGPRVRGCPHAFGDFRPHPVISAASGPSMASPSLRELATLDSVVVAPR